MNRLTRRLRILRGKRNGCFDRDQYYLEAASRARVARKVRCKLRRMEPVVLITPRWSNPARFLDDIAIDLSIGRPDIVARCLSVETLHGRTPYQAWTWLVSAIVEFCDVRLDGPVNQAVDRHGFRFVMAQAFQRANTGPRRALLIHGLEQLTLEIRQDLVSVFEEYMRNPMGPRRFNLLLAGSVDVPQFDVRGASRLLLPDYGAAEAMEALVEYVGPREPDVLQAAIEAVGGVPLLVDAVGRYAERSGKLTLDTDAMMRALGQLVDEVRGALEIVAADESLAERLEAIARGGPLTVDPERDVHLLRAGLVETLGATQNLTRIRAPLIAQLSVQT